MRQNEYKTIWEVPKYLSFEQPPLTEEMICDAENKIGHKLPKEYIEILKAQNGGGIKYELPDDTYPHSTIYGIGPHWPTILDFEDLWIHLDDEEDAEEVATLRGLVCFDGDGHWNMCLDYRTNKDEPKITVIDYENDERDYHIANSFSEYLSMLELTTKYDFVITPTGTVEETLSLISKTLGFNIEKSNDTHDCNPCWRGGNEEFSITVAPNKVVCGIIQENDKRYEEQKWQLTVNALQYPELAAGDIFLDVWARGIDEDGLSALRERILDELTKHSINVRPLGEVLNSEN